MPDTIVTDFQSDAYTAPIPSGSTSSSVLLNNSELDKAGALTVYVPDLTGTGVDVQVMATSGSGWVDLYDEVGSQVTIAKQTARNFNGVGCYAYQFVSSGVEGADRDIIVIGAFQVSLRGLA